MKDKEFRRLNRAELVEIIYQLQQDNQKLQEENAELKERLASRELRISEAGSIAEAALDLSDVFAKAQEAADIYLAQIHRNNADMELERSRIIADAQAEADDILRRAECAANAKPGITPEESEKQ